MVNIKMATLLCNSSEQKLLDCFIAVQQPAMSTPGIHSDIKVHKHPENKIFLFVSPFPNYLWPDLSVLFCSPHIFLWAFLMVCIYFGTEPKEKLRFCSELIEFSSAFDQKTTKKSEERNDDDEMTLYR
jgi:hypothetical protein